MTTPTSLRPHRPQDGACTVAGTPTLLAFSGLRVASGKYLEWKVLGKILARSNFQEDGIMPLENTKVKIPTKDLTEMTSGDRVELLYRITPNGDL